MKKKPPKRNPIASAVKAIRPKVVPDKRAKERAKTWTQELKLEETELHNL